MVNILLVDELAAHPLQDCDLSAIRSSAPLTDEEERRQIAQEIAALRAEQPEVIREKFVMPLLRGVASHHAGEQNA